MKSTPEELTWDMAYSGHAMISLNHIGQPFIITYGRPTTPDDPQMFYVHSEKDVMGWGDMVEDVVILANKENIKRHTVEAEQETALIQLKNYVRRQHDA